MKKIFVALLLALLASAANASLCTRWIDTNGFERVRCDKTNPYVRFSSPVEKREATAKDLEFRQGQPGSGSFVIFNSVDRSYTFCSKQGDRVTCN